MARREIVVCDACGKEDIEQPSCIELCVGSVMDTPYDSDKNMHRIDLCSECSQIAIIRVARHLSSPGVADLIAWVKTKQNEFRLRDLSGGLRPTRTAGPREK